jgi:hypothetical protein
MIDHMKQTAPSPMKIVPSQLVESYRFWEIATQWAQDRLQHEHVIARVMARGVVRDGLRVQSVDPRWCNPGTFELRGPIVGYVAKEGVLPIFIRIGALNHLRAVVEQAVVPDPHLLFEEFITKQDFDAWLRQAGLEKPSFWFAAEHDG